jgi:hypothetical protein
MINQRVAEATRLGYTRILAPAGTKNSLDKRGARRADHRGQAFQQILGSESKPNF